MNQDNEKIYIQTKLSTKALYNARPFLKWAGGKGQLLPEIEKRLPIFPNNLIKSYIEPFVGGGAVFFFLKSKFNIKESILIDNNKELLVGYQVIQKKPKELIRKLREVEAIYLEKTEQERKDFFYEQRNDYNLQMRNFDYNNFDQNWIDRAAHLIFLNRTCFNGLFRQNKKGEFNVPFGKYKNPTICNKRNILEVHNALKNAIIICSDFEKAGDYINKNSFVYFDPPYRPISSTANFTDYSSKGFNDSEQIRLADFFRMMNKKGAKLMLSNSDPKNHNPNDEFFDDLYKEFKIERIKAKRAISSNVDTRGAINELLIRNYS